MSEKGKRVSMETKDGKFRVKVDPNADGDAVLELVVDLAEVPDEILDLFKKKSEDN